MFIVILLPWDLEVRVHVYFDEAFTMPNETCLHQIESMANEH